MEQALIYPTSANPPTLGHADILKRMSQKFDRVYWVAATNPNKKLLFPLQERLAMMQDYVEHFAMQKVTVDHHDGAIIRYAIAKQASFLLRGLRNTSDFQFEFDLASGNRGIDQTIETICVFANPVFSSISSALVRELAILGENFGPYVIPSVERRILDFLQTYTPE